ncbi:MAG: sugar porter family MFS transporter [Bacteroidota bacterium]
MEKKRIGFVFLISVIAALGGLLFGFDTAVISGVVPYIEEYFELSSAQIGWVVGSLLLGAIGGVLSAGAPADKYGRRKVLAAAAVLFVISAVGTALAKDVAVFVTFRVLGGFAVGIASMISPMYIAEVAPAQHRGKLVSLNQLTIVIGILVAFYSNYLLSGVGENNWRWMLIIMAVPAALFFIALFFVPESPRWLIVVNNKEKALEVLIKINGEEEAKTEAENIENALMNHEKPSIKDLLNPGLRKALLIGIGLATLQQFTGINSIMYYAPMIFKESGLSTADAIFQTIAVGVVNLLFTLISIRIVDKVGRKPLLVYGSLVMAIFLSLLAVSFHLNWGGMFKLTFILGFIGAFAVSLGPVTWILIAEIFPNKVRGKAMSVSIVFVWISAFILSLFFPILSDGIGLGATFLILAFISALSFWFNVKYVPETKGKNLEEIKI